MKNDITAPMCVSLCVYYIQLQMVRLRHCLSVSGQLFEEVSVRIKRVKPLPLHHSPSLELLTTPAAASAIG